VLKITIVDGPEEQRLILEGRLAEPDLSALKSVWEEARSSLGGRRCVVDLRSATRIDHSGEGILLDMMRAGARFIACGVSTTHQLERLGIKCRGSASKVCH
jgi:ABC-type transporter Mla MlaB component